MKVIRSNAGPWGHVRVTTTQFVTHQGTSYLIETQLNGKTQAPVSVREDKTDALLLADALLDAHVERLIQMENQHA